MIGLSVSVVALRPIAAGAALTACRVDGAAEPAERSELLGLRGLLAGGGRCGCIRCMAERGLADGHVELPGLEVSALGSRAALLCTPIGRRVASMLSSRMIRGFRWSSCGGWRRRLSGSSGTVTRCSSSRPCWPGCRPTVSLANGRNTGWPSVSGSMCAAANSARLQIAGAALYARSRVTGWADRWADAHSLLLAAAAIAPEHSELMAKVREARLYEPSGPAAPLWQPNAMQPSNRATPRREG